MNTTRGNIIGKYFMEYPILESFLLDGSERIVMKTFYDGRHYKREFHYESKIFEINTFPLKDKRENIAKITWRGYKSDQRNK